jgi:hypothetical protein
MKKFSIALEIKRKIYSLWKVAVIGSLLLFLSSCSNNEGGLVCSVGQFSLTEERLAELIAFHKNDFNEETRRDKVINLWAQQKLIEIEIQKTLPKKYTENEIKTAHEASNLHLFELENNYIRSQLDSSITDQEIKTYYKKHRENYKKSSFIVKALYIKTSDTLLGHNSLHQTFLLKNDKDLNEVKKYGNLYATNFYLEKDKWIYFDDLVKEVPMSQEQKEDLIRNRGEATFEIDGYTHFINVLDYRSKTISSPMEVEKSIIRTHILKRRVHKLREEAKETILKDVKENNPVVYY